MNFRKQSDKASSDIYIQKAQMLQDVCLQDWGLRMPEWPRHTKHLCYHTGVPRIFPRSFKWKFLSFSLDRQNIANAKYPLNSPTRLYGKGCCKCRLFFYNNRFFLYIFHKFSTNIQPSDTQIQEAFHHYYSRAHTHTKFFSKIYCFTATFTGKQFTNKHFASGSNSGSKVTDKTVQALLWRACKILLSGNTK